MDFNNLISTLTKRDEIIAHLLEENEAMKEILEEFTQEVPSYTVGFNLNPKGNS